jgi:quercetin dioxygenase-like cupin family protein
MTTSTDTPKVLPTGRGVADLWWLGGRLTVKAGLDDTGGRFSQLLFTDPRGTASPLHVHNEADEAFYLISGEVTMFLGDDRHDLSPGDFALVPHGVTHAYLVRSDEAQFLATIVPGGTEQFFIELGVPITAGDTRPTHLRPDPVEFARRAKPYGIEIVGPPPTLPAPNAD